MEGCGFISDPAELTLGKSYCLLPGSGSSRAMGASGLLDPQGPMPAALTSTTYGHTGFRSGLLRPRFLMNFSTAFSARGIC